LPMVTTRGLLSPSLPRCLYRPPSVQSVSQSVDSVPTSAEGWQRIRGTDSTDGLSGMASWLANGHHPRPPLSVPSPLSLPPSIRSIRFAIRRQRLHQCGGLATDWGHGFHGWAIRHGILACQWSPSAASSLRPFPAVSTALHPFNPFRNPLTAAPTLLTPSMTCAILLLGWSFAFLQGKHKGGAN